MILNRRQKRAQEKYQLNTTQ